MGSVLLPKLEKEAQQNNFIKSYYSLPPLMLMVRNCTVRSDI
ncbi:hypothetical protein WGM54_18005 [Paenibacillus polymyxa]